MLCPQCGKSIFDNDAICPYCGGSVRGGAPQGQPRNGFDNSGFAVFNAGNPNQPMQAPQNTVSTKTSPALIVLITVFSLMLLTSGVLLFIKPGYLIKKDDLPAETVRSETQPSVSRQTSAVTAPPVVQNEPQTSDEEKVKHAVSPKQQLSDLNIGGGDSSTTASEKPKETTASKAPEKTTTTAADNSSFDADNAAYNEAMSLSTDERPKMDEFGWIYGQESFIYAPPGFGEIQYNPLSWSGSWKYMIILNPTNSSGIFTRSWGNITIGVYNGAADCTIDWYMGGTDYSEMYEENAPDSHFFGDVSGGGLTANGDMGFLSLEYMWKYDGGQYAIGTFTTKDGLPAYIALMRP